MEIKASHRFSLIIKIKVGGIISILKRYKALKKNSTTIKNKIFLIYTLTFAVLILLISFVLLNFLNKLMIDEIGETRVDILRQIGERSNAIKNSSITISNLYNLDTKLLHAVRENLDTDMEQEVKMYLDNMKKSYDLVFSDVGIAYDVIVIGENGFCYSSQAGDKYDFKSLETQLWYKTINEKQGGITFISSFKDVFGTQKDKYVFSASRIMKDNLGRKIGTLLITIDETYLANLYTSVLNGSNYIYIIDNDGSIISHTNKNMRGMNFIMIDNFRKFYGANQFHIIQKSQGKYLISNYYDTQTGWTIIEEMPVASVFSEISKVLYIIFAFLGVCLALAVIVSYYVSYRISRPLLNLCNSMDQVKEGNFDVISNVKGYKEIDQLKHSFNGMAHEIKLLLEDIKKKEAFKRQAELDFLRAQINPHFLYNTLFSIKCSVELGKNQQVIYMLSAFIDLLKMSLREDADLITLNEEVETTEKYIILEQMRYGDKLSFEIEMEENTKECMVPALILQPIVENAIFHGIEAKDDMGILVITSKIENEKLYISIIDDGVGMTGETIESLLEQCNLNEYKKSKSIGIVNVAHRIKFNFGTEYGIGIDSEIGIGTTVTLILPIIMGAK